MGFWIAVALLGAPKEVPPPECKSASGQTACGYHCLADASNVRCAKTLQGICNSIGGNVVCFDPPAYVIRVMGSNLPRPQCLADGDNLACGYQCTRDAGTLKCATTPLGVCRGLDGQVVCFDPPPALFAIYRGEIPKSECKDESGKLACGYHCTASNGQVRCASTPQGVCRADVGKIVCFDPKGEVLCAYGSEIPKPECLSSEGKLACGYHCLSDHGQVACAQSPDGVCRHGDSNPVCFDPPADDQGQNSSRALCLEYLELSRK